MIKTHDASHLSSPTKKLNSPTSRELAFEILHGVNEQQIYDATRMYKGNIYTQTRNPYKQKSSALQCSSAERGFQ